MQRTNIQQGLQAWAAIALLLIAACGGGHLGSDSAPASASGFATMSRASASEAEEGLTQVAESQVNLAEELWIIARPSSHAAPVDPDPEQLGCGALLARTPDSTREVPVPLEHTEVEARIAGFLAAVDVTQEFHNPFAEKIEAVYRFPLPQDSAVHEFLMTIGERTIRGILREREEAERIYAQARRAGHAASLLSQERPNVFTQRVANIEPSESIDVHIRYLHALSYADGVFEYRFPMVVGPRYNPPGHAEGIGAVARATEHTSGQAVEVEYLRPEERSGHDIGLAVELEAGIAVHRFDSPSHAVDIEPAGETGARIVLREYDSIPNRDFVLRWEPKEASLQGALLTHQVGEQGTFALMLVPPSERERERRPLELSFVVDVSGSMEGANMELARRAVRAGLEGLREGDTFQLHSFSNDVDTFARGPVRADSDQLRDARRWASRLEAGGGTEMKQAVEAAFDGSEDPERTRVVAFLTDGMVGNEAEVLRELDQNLGDAHVFAFGIGNASNTFLAERLAVLGRGAVGYIGPNDDVEATMERFLDTVAHPILADPWIDWAGAEVADVYPRELPDLWAGRPLLVTGRYTGALDGVKLRGTRGERAELVNLASVRDASDHPGVPLVWARRKIAALMDGWIVSGGGARPELAGQITQVALSAGLMTNWTSFVAVDSMHVTAGDSGVTVDVPVPMPEGVRYETTVGG